MTPGPATSERSYPRALLRQERSRDTRRRIAWAASQCWAAEGLAAVSVDAICEKAGVARSTFYFHFDKKEDVLWELRLMTAESVAGEVNEALRSGTNSLRAVLGVFVEGVTRRVRPIPKPLFGSIMAKGMAGIAKMGTCERDDFGSTLAAVLRAAQQRGELSPAADCDELGMILGGMVMECLLRWAYGSTPHGHLTELLQERITIFLDGIGPAA